MEPLARSTRVDQIVAAIQARYDRVFVNMVGRLTDVGVLSEYIVDLAGGWTGEFDKETED